jgi:D-3-phosphoglycerate dehydrogenase
MRPWRILVADELSAEGIGILSAAGEVTVKKGLSPAGLGRELPPYHALVVRSATRVDATSLADAAQLVVIGRAGIGIDNIDVDAATARGIVVMNTPESGAVTTAELAIAMLLAVARKIPLADRLMRERRWEKGRLTGVELTGKTLGLLGLGRIGRVVADRAAGLRMRVIAFDPHVPEGRVPPGVLMVPFERCLAESDFVSVHVPLLDSTRHLLDGAAFALMKQGSRLVHCARGGIVDEAALVAALHAGHLAGAALDVFEQEPPPPDHPLLALDSVVLTPHLGASTEEARRLVAVDIANQVVDCLRTGLVVNGVNVPHVSPADAAFLYPFLVLAERLGSLLVQASPGRIERVHVITQGEVGERTQRPVQVAALVGALRPRAARPVTAVSAETIAREAGIELGSERSTLKKDFVNLVRVEVTVEGRMHSASGTLIGRRHLRMVELDGFLLDAIPEGHLLVTLHHDRPGVIGRIGTALGDAGVNISRLQLGVARERTGVAVGVLNVDAPVPEPVLAALRAMPDVETVTSVSL